MVFSDLSPCQSLNSTPMARKGAPRRRLRTLRVRLRRISPPKQSFFGAWAPRYGGMRRLTVPPPGRRLSQTRLARMYLAGMKHCLGKPPSWRRGAHAVCRLDYGLTTDDRGQTMSACNRPAHSSHIPSSSVLRPLDFKLPSANYQLSTSNFELQTSNFKLQTSNFEL